MKKLLAIILSLLLVFAVIPMAFGSADTAKYQLSVDPADSDFTITGTTFNYNTYNDGGYFYVESAKAGQYATFKADDFITPASYLVKVVARSNPTGRAQFNFTLGNNESVLVDSNATYEKFKEFTVYEKVDLYGYFEFKIEATSTGKIFFDSVILEKVGEYEGSEEITYPTTVPTTIPVVESEVCKWNLGEANFTPVQGWTMNDASGKDTFFSTQYQGEGAYFVSHNNQVGNTVTLVSKAAVLPGIYSAKLFARVTGARALIDLSINGVKVATNLNTGNKGENAFPYTNTAGYNIPIDLTENEILIKETSQIEFTITVTNVSSPYSGNLFLNALELTRTSEFSETEAKIKVDGEVVDVITPNTTYVIPTPAAGYYYTDGTNDYYGGEEVAVRYGLSLRSVVKTTKVVYTMDEGKELAGATAYFGEGSVMEVNGDNKLAIKAKADAYAYFQLPSAWSSKPYYKPTKITFTASANNTTQVKAFKTLSFAETLKDTTYDPTGTYYKIATDLTYFAKTVTFNVTEDMYAYKYITGNFYSNNWSEANPYYAYIDDVIIDYEYDFDYVEPVEPTTYDITVDGEVVATVEEGTEYTLPELPAGKYYVGNPETTFVVTEAVEFTTATYTFDITVDGVVVDTVAYGETFTLPALEAGKYYVDVTETTFVVTEALSFTTATYTYEVKVDGTVVATVEYGTIFNVDYKLPELEPGKYYVEISDETFVITEDLSFTTANYIYELTIDGKVVATAKYGETFVIPAPAEGMQYVDWNYVDGQEIVVIGSLTLWTEKIPEQDGTVTSAIVTEDKAAIRLDSDVQGIRFYSTINLEGLDVEEVGTLIGPSDLAGDYLTMEDEQAGNAVKVTYDLSNGLYDGKYVVGSMVGIKEKNWARYFSARAYVILKDGTVLYSASTSTRNLAYIADAFIADTNSNYNTLDTELKASVDAWAAAND